jgi:hypothetical protein
MFQVTRIQPPPQRLEEMDVDLGEGPSNSVVAPGEVIASAKEYMRCVSLPSPPSSSLAEILS